MPGNPSQPALVFSDFTFPSSCLTSDILVIVGPTAVGKSAAAVEAALACNGEIVSCDAMQVYREVQVISDKPSAEQRSRVPHHVIDAVSVEEEFSAARYRELAEAAIRDILSRGRKPVVCGGSGMYMMALLDGLCDSGEVDPELRASLERQAAREGLAALYQRLTEVDPGAARKINPNDPQRIIRALEVFMATGLLLSERQKVRDGLWGKHNIAIVGLTRPRETLYARAEARIDAMLKGGAVDEVRMLLGKKLTPSSSRLIGIPELGGVVRGAHDLERAVYLMKRNTRHYIKRQLTWFHKDKRIRWVEGLV